MISKWQPLICMQYLDGEKKIKANPCLHLQSFLGHWSPRRKPSVYHKQLLWVCIRALLKRAEDGRAAWAQPRKMENGWCPEEVLAGPVWNSWLMQDGNWLFLQFTCRREQSSLSQRGHRRQDGHCFHDNGNFPCLCDLCWAVVWDKDFKQHCAGPAENIPVGNTHSVPNAMFCCSLPSVVTLLCRLLCLLINHRHITDIRLDTEEPLLVRHLFFRSKTVLSLCWVFFFFFARGGLGCESSRKSQWV